MRLIVDTHAVLWWMLADPRLSPIAYELIEQRNSVRYISAVSAFEITNKVRSGKLDVAREIASRFAELCEAGGFRLLDVRTDHALLAGRLLGAPRDPFDRLIAAQAIIEGMPVLSVDGAFAALGAEAVW